MNIHFLRRVALREILQHLHLSLRPHPNGVVQVRLRKHAEAKEKKERREKNF